MESCCSFLLSRFDWESGYHPSTCTKPEVGVSVKIRVRGSVSIRVRDSVRVGVRIRVWISVKVRV